VVALAWLLHQPAVTAPIVGPRTLEQLTGALRALDVTLDEKALGRLDEIFPGPGGRPPRPTPGDPPPLCVAFRNEARPGLLV
jgi:diketogulonate reductase-like aldo/keto reductase